ncbi:MAG: hypothetical protein WA958_13495 [Tunicatimonas sp.]
MQLQEFFQLSFSSQMNTFNKHARFLVSREQRWCVIGLYELNKSLVELWVDRRQHEIVGFREVRDLDQLHSYVEHIPLELYSR